ncbi:MAG TPA: NADH dehydrogenase (quinone) subunit D [Acidimicrobiia bacterium]|nr:NADH dehydrogenase (quinone) subunit D [Acidimicrobiia bacterium]
MDEKTVKGEGGRPPSDSPEETLDIWVAGTEEPQFHPTDEGAQEIDPGDSEARLDDQFGRVISDDYVFDDEVADDERMVVNMGPQHPSTHGVLRLQLELEGEVIRRTKPIIGYLHTGMEKTAEQLTFGQGPTNVTRMDYLAPLHCELGYSLATERLLDVEVPPRAQAIRVLMTELNRISSHLVALATNGMDVGALSMMIYGFRERESILAFFEKTTGLRMNHNYIRPGGVAADLAPGWKDDVAAILEDLPKRLRQYDDLLKENPIWVARTRGVGVISAEEAIAYSITGPALRASGVDWDLRKVFPYSGIEKYEFDVPLGSNGDVYDRYRVRVEEITESLKIVEQVMDSMPKGDYRIDDRKITPPPRARIDESMEALIHHFKLFTEGFKVPHGETYVAVESPRGELGCYLVSDGQARPYRMHTRAPSFYNLQGLPIAMADSLVADTVATIASMDPVMGDVDR